MKHTARRRRHRRRKAAERANSISRPTAFAEPSPAPSGPMEEPIVGTMPGKHSEKIDLPFEIAGERPSMTSTSGFSIKPRN